jgi:triosephosphate isomerase
LQERFPTISLGIQNFHPKEKGAFTGEISVKQAKEIGASYALIGHSERRMYFSESNAFLKEKVDAALQYGLIPVFCCGEPLEIREAESQNVFVETQIEESLFHLSSDAIAQVVIAYEPIWAIGTGKTASSQQAQDMHAHIRSVLAKKYGEEVAQKISILYGGSCNPSNASELFACPDVDGGLIGGASLVASDFCTIANSY